MFFFFRQVIVVLIWEINPLHVTFIFELHLMEDDHRNFQFPKSLINNKLKQCFIQFGQKIEDRSGNMCSSLKIYLLKKVKIANYK